MTPPPPFRYLLRARYPECDPQGIVFNARYGDWTDLATTELLRAIDPALLLPGGVDYRLRRQETEWRAPARFDEVIEALPVVTAVGTTSFTVTTTFTRIGAGPDTPPVRPGDPPAILAVVVTVYVLVDGGTGAKRPVPTALAARLRMGAPGRITDHAAVGGGRVVRVLRAVDRRTMPWRNGGGLTHEILRHGEGSPGGPGFDLRISIAEVSADGPFSAFPGVDRVLTLLDGPGFVLRRSDGATVPLTGAAPFAFHGEDAWDCALRGGACHDLNVMVDRARCAASVRATEPGLVGGAYWFARAAGRVGGVRVDEWDLAVLDGTVLAEVPGLAIAVVPR